MPDAHTRLTAGTGRVAEIGCGEGVAAVTIARAFPEVLVDGFDLDHASVAAARRHAQEAGLADRVRFEVADAVALTGRGCYDLVLCIEMLHDVSDPVGVLAAMRRLRSDDGAVLVVDERVVEQFGVPAEPVERLLYAFSTLHCLPAGMAQEPSAATGAVLRPGTVQVRGGGRVHDGDRAPGGAPAVPPVPARRLRSSPPRPPRSARARAGRERRARAVTLSVVPRRRPARVPVPRIRRPQVPALRVPWVPGRASSWLGLPVPATAIRGLSRPAPRRRSSAPSPLLLLSEPPRAGLDLAALLAAWPVLAAAPRGDGHPVLVLPGLLTGDPETLFLRNALRLLGHRVHAWRLGTNRGATGRVVSSLRDRVDRLHRDSGRRVSIVGWSLGGIYAQELARARPGAVRRLVTLGSPVLRRHTWVQDLSRLVDQSTHLLPLAGQLPRPWAEPGPLRVPATSVYTRSDGIVDWRVCRLRSAARRENVEVHGSHLGLAHNPAVLWLLADRLAQAEGSWSPFRPPVVFRPFFPARA